MVATSDSFKSRKTLTVDNQTYTYYDINQAEQNGLANISKLPFTLKVLLENLLRHEDDNTVTVEHLKAMSDWLNQCRSQTEIAYRPARVLMQDFTGVPAIVDLAAMRDAIAHMNKDPELINPLIPVHLIIDHSVQVDKYGKGAFLENEQIEMKRNHERYAFLRWGSHAFHNFSVVPPGTGICHQVNLEYLAKGVWHKEIDEQVIAYPDTLVGTDSHTTMINGLGVLGWGVGGIEAEAAMLGQPISMLIPEVIGFKLTGALREGVTATDLVLTVTEMLRRKGVVGKFVEFYGAGLSHLALADRATVANMAPEYGATCGFFPIDEQTITYLKLTGRDEHIIKLVKAYCQAQGLWRDDSTPEPTFTDTVTLDLSKVEPSLAGPKRPQDRVNLKDLAKAFDDTLTRFNVEAKSKSVLTSADFNLAQGAVVIAAITSCTNTSNPSVLMAAGLLAKKAVEKGLSTKPWVKTSLAPGSKVVTDYLAKAGLQNYLDQLGFNLVGYGCTTCIGNSGPLPPPVHQAITENDLVVSAVLSGNRNFEGRVHPLTKANWLASPPLVVAFALAGTTKINMNSDPLGKDKAGEPVYLRDIWPTNHEIAEAVEMVNNAMFRKEYKDVFTGDVEWQSIKTTLGVTYQWDNYSTYVKNPPFFEHLEKQATPISSIEGARILALLGDSITTDHISPAGVIKVDSPAGKYLQAHDVDVKDFNSYGSRRGNHEVMMRGTFANIRIRNEMVPGVEGGYTRYIPDEETLSIFDAAMKYQQQKTPLVIIAGKEYGTGSSRDWAAKGPRLLGIKAVIAESFERIHRSNLVGMGVLPLQFQNDQNRKTLKLTGNETIDLTGLDQLTPQGQVTMTIHYEGGRKEDVALLVRIDTKNELAYYRRGGILQYVLHTTTT